MKYVIFLFAIILIAVSCNAQNLLKFGEQEAIEEGHIDFTTHYIWFVIHGQIEIDGHVFCNDREENPIIFQANLDGIAIVDTSTGIKYEHRVCNKKGCKIIHLVEKCEGTRYYFNDPGILTPTPFYQLDNNLYKHED